MEENVSKWWITNFWRSIAGHSQYITGSYLVTKYLVYVVNYRFSVLIQSFLKWRTHPECKKSCMSRKRCSPFLEVYGAPVAWSWWWEMMHFISFIYCDKVFQHIPNLPWYSGYVLSNFVVPTGSRYAEKTASFQHMLINFLFSPPWVRFCFPRFGTQLYWTLICKEGYQVTWKTEQK